MRKNKHNLKHNATVDLRITKNFFKCQILLLLQSRLNNTHTHIFLQTWNINIWFFFYCNKGRVMNEQKKLFFLSISGHETLLKKKRHVLSIKQVINLNIHIYR